MALKENWKKTGQDLGNAFSGLGKNIIRSAKTGVDKAVDWADVDKDTPDKNVFNDGSWKETGKDLGHAFSDLGKSIVNSGRVGVEKATDWASDENEGENPADEQAEKPEEDASEEKAE